MTSDSINEWLIKAIIGVFSALVGGVGFAQVRKHRAGAIVAEAGAVAAEADAKNAVSVSDAVTQMFGIYKSEVEQLRAHVNSLSGQVNDLQRSYASVRQLYRASAAGERRYREAFGELYKVHTQLLIEARGKVNPDVMERIERQVSDLVAKLSLPLNLDHSEEEEAP